MKLTKTFRFEASHRLPFHPGKCRRLHGHSWVLTVEVEGPIEAISGMVIDYGDIKRLVEPVVEDLDHKHLGTWDGLIANYSSVWKDGHVHWLPFDFNSTSENLLLAIAQQIPSALPWSALTLEETCTCKATLTRKEYEDGRQEFMRRQENAPKEKEEVKREVRGCDPSFARQL